MNITSITTVFEDGRIITTSGPFLNVEAPVELSPAIEPTVEAPVEITEPQVEVAPEEVITE